MDRNRNPLPDGRGWFHAPATEADMQDAPPATFLLGFDLGGTKSAAVLGTPDGRVIGRRQRATGEPEPTVRALIEAGRELCGGRLPAACGVSCGSPLSREKGLIQAPPNMPRWIDVPLGAMLAEAFETPVNLENDADAAALAEWRWGVDREVNTLAYLTCGTGQGAGLIVGGRLHRGACNLAGEIGHVRLLPLGPVGCRKAGSVEGLTSGRALGELAKLRLAENPGETPLHRLPLERITGREVGDAARGGDDFSLAVVRELAEHLGHTCAILIDVLNPERILLGSLALRLEEVGFIQRVRRAARAEAMERSFQACTIDRTALGEHAQDLAALAAAQEGARVHRERDEKLKP